MHPKQLLIIPGPLIHGGLCGLLDGSPSPTSCLRPPTAFWLFPRYSFVFITQGHARGKKRQAIPLCYPLAPIKYLNNWPSPGISGGPFIPFL